LLFSDLSFPFLGIILNSVYILQHTGNHSQFNVPAKLVILLSYSSASLLREASNSPILRISPCAALWRVFQRWFQDQFP